MAKTILNALRYALGIFSGKDVYKRQIEFKGAGCKLCEVGSLLTVDHRLADLKFGIGDYFSVDFIPDLVDGSEPVSYTHLDVYKRQTHSTLMQQLPSGRKVIQRMPFAASSPAR